MTRVNSGDMLVSRYLLNLIIEGKINEIITDVKKSKFGSIGTVSGRLKLIHLGNLKMKVAIVDSKDRILVSTMVELPNFGTIELGINVSHQIEIM